MPDRESTFPEPRSATIARSQPPHELSDFNCSSLALGRVGLRKLSRRRQNGRDMSECLQHVMGFLWVVGADSFVSFQIAAVIAVQNNDL